MSRWKHASGVKLVWTQDLAGAGRWPVAAIGYVAAEPAPNRAPVGLFADDAARAVAAELLTGALARDGIGHGRSRALPRPERPLWTPMEGAVLADALVRGRLPVPWRAGGAAEACWPQMFSARRSFFDGAPAPPPLDQAALEAALDAIGWPPFPDGPWDGWRDIDALFDTVGGYQLWGEGESDACFLLGPGTEASAANLAAWCAARGVPFEETDVLPVW